MILVGAQRAVPFTLNFNPKNFYKSKYPPPLPSPIPQNGGGLGEGRFSQNQTHHFTISDFLFDLISKSSNNLFHPCPPSFSRMERVGRGQIFPKPNPPF
jgi:hypothetical protein